MTKNIRRPTGSFDPWMRCPREAMLSSKQFHHVSAISHFVNSSVLRIGFNEGLFRSAFLDPSNRFWKQAHPMPGMFSRLSDAKKLVDLLARDQEEIRVR